MKYVPNIMWTCVYQETESQNFTFLLTHQRSLLPIFIFIAICYLTIWRFPSFFLNLKISLNFCTVEMNVCIILVTCILVDARQQKTVRGAGDISLGIQISEDSSRYSAFFINFFQRYIVWYCSYENYFFVHLPHIR